MVGRQQRGGSGGQGGGDGQRQGRGGGATLPHPVAPAVRPGGRVAPAVVVVAVGRAAVAVGGGSGGGHGGGDSGGGGGGIPLRIEDLPAREGPCIVSGATWCVSMGQAYFYREPSAISVDIISLRHISYARLGFRMGHRPSDVCRPPTSPSSKVGAAAGNRGEGGDGIAGMTKTVAAASATERWGCAWGRRAVAAPPRGVSAAAGCSGSGAPPPVWAGVAGGGPTFVSGGQPFRPSLRLLQPTSNLGLSRLGAPAATPSSPWENRARPPGAPPHHTAHCPSPLLPLQRRP